MSEEELEPYEKEIRDTFYREISAIPSNEIQVTANYKEDPAFRQELELRPLNPNRSRLDILTNGDEVIQIEVGKTTRFLKDWPKTLPPSMDLIEAFIRAVIYGGITETQWLFRGRILSTCVVVVFDEYGVKRTGIPTFSYYWSDPMRFIRYPLAFLQHEIEKKTIVYEPYITK